MPVDKRRKKEEEIRQRWEEKEFQSRQQLAQKMVVRYIRKLDSIYMIKTGYGFLHYVECRTKTPNSIAAKLERKGYPVDFDTAVMKLNDISGVRIICYTLKEIYWIARQFGGQEIPRTWEGKELFTVIKIKDFIRKPKKSGYESYHLILDVRTEEVCEQKDVRDTNKTEPNKKEKTGKTTDKENKEQKKFPETVRVELQLRTIGMDAWASLDTMIRYKSQDEFPQELTECMKRYAEVNKQFDELIQKMKTIR